MDRKRMQLLPNPRYLKIKSEKNIRLSDFSLRSATGLGGIQEKYRQALSLDFGLRKKKALFQKDRLLKEEEYSLRISPEEIRIGAGGERGFFYCLQTLLQIKDGNLVPAVEVDDGPSLQVRGLHICFDNLRQMGFEEAVGIIKTMAKFKLNTALIEYGDRFPFKKHPLVSTSASLSLSEVKKIHALAKENYIEIIPLLQSLGHLDYVLETEEFAYLNEGGKEGGRQICPSNPDSLGVFTGLAEEIIDVCPESRYFHIGADEARYLGVCPRCRKRMEKVGKGGLFVEHVNKVCRWVEKRGFTPILWDDMPCTYPEMLDVLDKKAVIMYWDYWTTGEKTPLLLARSEDRGIVHDKRWQEEWKEELNETEMETLRNFGRSLDLEKDLEAGYLKRFRPYLGAEFPKYIKSFPFIKFYRDKGFKVIGAPIAEDLFANCRYGLPNYHRTADNIREFARRCISDGALGIVSTDWINFPVETLYPGILATAQFSWGGVEAK